MSGLSDGLMGNVAMQRRTLKTCEWAGCALGLAGAFLLATNTAVSKHGWIAFLIANVAMIIFANGIKARGLMLQQLGFLATSALGIYRAFLPFG